VERSRSVVCVGDEGQVPVEQPAQVGRGIRLARQYHQAAGNVIQAVTVFPPGRATLRVFQQPGVVGQA
jgi:hypothetical protein